MGQTLDTLQPRLAQDMKDALRAKDQKTLGTIRLVRAEIQRKEKDERTLLHDNDVIQLLRRMVKQRKEALEQFEKAGREDLAQQERHEIDVINRYMPAPVDDAAIEQAIDQAIKDGDIQSMRDMGKLMARVKELLPSADMGVVAAKAKQKMS